MACSLLKCHTREVFPVHLSTTASPLTALMLFFPLSVHYYLTYACLLCPPVELSSEGAGIFVCFTTVSCPSVFELMNELDKSVTSSVSLPVPFHINS